MKKNNLLLLSSLLLLASCGQVENPTSNESEQPSQIPPSEITPTEVPTSEVTPTEEVSSDIVEEDYIVDENGIKRYKFDESGYEEFTFFDVEDIYLTVDETYYLSKMLVKDASLYGVSYFIETPENFSYEEGVLKALSLSDNVEVSGTLYVYDETRLQKVNVVVVDYYEYGSYFTSVDLGRLYNKNVVFFGDSITHNWVKYPNGKKPETEEELKWAETTSLGYPTHYIPLLNDVCKFASVTNAAWSGGTMAYLPKSTERFTYKSFPGAIDENQEAVANADICFVFYGTNDLTDQVPIGKMSDKMSLSDINNSSFMAGMQFGINYIRSLNEDVNIVFMNLLTRTYTYSGGITLQDYNEAIHEICKTYMVKELDVNSLFDEKEFYLYSNDGLHLNPEGYKVLVDYILTRKINK